MKFLLVFYLYLLSGLSISKKNILLNYLEITQHESKLTKEKIVERSIDFSLSNHYYETYRNDKKLKSLDLIVHNPQRKKYLIIKDKPIMATYILWKYDVELDEAEQKRIQYFVEVAARRGYNKFILQMVFVKDPLKYKIGTHHMVVIFKLIYQEIKKFLQRNLPGLKIILKDEIIMESEVQEITNIYGGFFLMATTVDNEEVIEVK
jgi:hypothetical protein